MPQAPKLPLTLKQIRSILKSVDQGCPIKDFIHPDGTAYDALQALLAFDAHVKALNTTIKELEAKLALALSQGGVSQGQPEAPVQSVGENPRWMTRGQRVRINYINSEDRGQTSEYILLGYDAIGFWLTPLSQSYMLFLPMHRINLIQPADRKDDNA